MIHNPQPSTTIHSAYIPLRTQKVMLRRASAFTYYILSFVSFSISTRFTNGYFLTMSKKPVYSHSDLQSSRRAILKHVASNAFAGSILTLSSTAAFPSSSSAKCSDIESCREIGEEREKKQLEENPIYRLNSGVRYKILQPGIGSDTVQKDSKLDLIFSVSTLSGGYIYSQGFGFEKVDIGGKMISDSGLDSLLVQLGRAQPKERDIPLGIEQALVGMKKGERRRIELPPNVGYDTSDWKPQPKSRRAQAGLKSYKRILEGNGSNQPPFAASTIWDVEVLKIR